MALTSCEYFWLWFIHFCHVVGTLRVTRNILHRQQTQLTSQKISSPKCPTRHRVSTSTRWHFTFDATSS